MSETILETQHGIWETTYGTRQVNRLIQRTATKDLEAQIELVAKVQKACSESSDYAEGVSAFLQNRSPTFSGEHS